MSEADDAAEMQLLVAFPVDSQDFVLGFEAGGIWQEMDGHGTIEIDRGFDSGIPIRADNIEVIRRMAAVMNYRLETRPEKDGWVGIKLTWVGKGKNKPALKLVSEGADHE